MKILFISPKYEGGIGGHAKRIAEKLEKEGFEIELMNVPHIPIKNLKNPSFTILGTIKAALNSKEYDIVHAWNIPSAFVMKKIKSDKKILSVHGIYGEQIEQIHSKTTSKLGKKAEEEALKIANVYTTDSKYVQNYYKKNLGLNFNYLPAPLDISKFSEIETVKKKNDQIIFIGRDSYEKGIDILKGIEENIRGNVVYCTNLEWNEAMKKLKESTILVVPSRMESMPQVIKEAFFLKIPVIATDVGGISELIEHKKTGILVPNNDPKKLTDEINNLLESIDMQNQIKNNAYSFIMENFTFEKLFSIYVKFYHNLMKN